MDMVKDLMKSWHDNYTVKRVFGDPIEKDGITVIPVALVAGGGAGGSSPAGAEAEGRGGGFGGGARPAGVYVVRPDGVEWQPALDVTMLGLAGIALAALITVVLGRTLRRRR